MAEFQEVMNEFKRMCWHYQRRQECPKPCPMSGVNISQCRKIAFEKPEVTEKTVMDWAAENPEPVYPTWNEWLHTTPFIKTEFTDMGQKKCFMWDEPIPSDMARKLGVPPRPAT